MANETNRKESRKKITLPDNSFLYIPVIDQIQFKDPKERMQEHVFRFNNTEASSRKVHVKNVHNRTTGGESAQILKVERVEEFNVKDPKKQNQEYGYRLVNDDPPPRGSDGTGPGHSKTHVVRYTKNNTPSGVPWVDVELIDQIEVKDPKRRNQEFVFRLTNKPIGDKVVDTNDPYNPTFEEVDTSLPLSPGTTDPPYRLDPFKNIVNFSSSSVRLSLSWQWFGSVDTNGLAGTSPCDNPVFVDPATHNFGTRYDSVFRINGPYFTPQNGVTVHGVPSISTNVFTFAPWRWGLTEFIQTRILASSGTISLQAVAGDGEGPRCVTTDDTPGVRGLILAVGGDSLVPTGDSLEVDATGITADFDGSTWIIDSANIDASPGFELSPGGISVTLFMKRT